MSTFTTTRTAARTQKSAPRIATGTGTKPTLVKEPRRNGEPDASKKPTAAEINKYLELQERRKNLEREARSIYKAESSIGEKIEAYTTSQLAKTGNESTTLAGFTLMFVDGRVSPAWKREYIDALGEDAANAVVARTPASQSLVVERS